MLENLKQNDLVITSNKKIILKYLNDTKQLLNLKIMSLKEFVDNYFGYTNQKAIYYLIKKYHYKFDIAKVYLDNFLFIDSLYQELELNNLIIKTPLFKESISRIVVIDTFLDPYIAKEVEKYEHLYLNEETKNYIPAVKKLKTLEEEVNYVAISILKLLDKIDINKIFIVNLNQDYYIAIKRFFAMYNIPLNLAEKKKIYGTISVKLFLEELKNSKDLESALNKIEKDEIYNYIIDVCNKYQFTSIDDIVIYCIEEELKNTYLQDKKLVNAINIIDFDQMIDKDAYYFLLGFNEGICPLTFKDEDYLSDAKKTQNGILTSLEKNILEKQKVINKVSSFSNLIITYKQKQQSVDCYPSVLIEQLNLPIQTIENNEFSYSHIYNKLKLASLLDNFIKYNIIDPNLSLLYNNYQDLPYLAYDNKYHQIDVNLFRKFINSKLTLSYSSLDNFYHCSFRYYIANILKLDKYEETFMTFIGNLFHYILSLAFKEDFDFETSFQEFIKDKNFNAKEEHFISRLKIKLQEIIKIIKAQDQYSLLNKTLYEQKITVPIQSKIDVNFVGIIDKIKYDEIDNQKYIAVIDYKTGIPNVNINNLIYGLSMQLPIYLYLLKHVFKEDINIAGFYLQKIIHENISFQYGKDYDHEIEKLYYLDGFSNDNENILSKFDQTYTSSKFIKSLKMSSKGFYSYAKVLSNEQINKIISLVDEKINEAIKAIENAEFSINPKVIDNKNIGCEFCKFKDICYKKEEDMNNLKSVNYQDFLNDN